MNFHVSSPSRVSKKEAHFGHLVFVSFDDEAHPREKKHKKANTKKRPIHFLFIICSQSLHVVKNRFFMEKT